MNMNTDGGNIYDHGNIVDGLADNWSYEEKQSFIEDWLNDSYLIDVNEIPNNCTSNVDVNKHESHCSQRILDDRAKTGNDFVKDTGGNSVEYTDSKEETFLDSQPQSSDYNVNIKGRRRRETFLDSESQGNDSEAYQDASDSSTDENAEENINTGRKKRKTETIFDSESQGNNSEVYQNASSTTFTSVIPEVSTATNFQRIIVLDSQSQEDSKEIELDSTPVPSTRTGWSDALSNSDGQSGSETSDGDPESDNDANSDGDDDDQNSTSSFPVHLKEEFPIYVEYLLSFCLDIKFINSNEKKAKIERKLDDLENMLKSEAWTSEFRQAMEALPNLLSCQLHGRRGGCDACARAGRIASQRLTFTGAPYDRNNFETQESSQPNEASFDVGRYCATRSKLYHRVFHYKFHLRQECDDAVNQFSEDNITPDSVRTKCMDNEQWWKEKYRGFSFMIDEVFTWFESANKYK